MIKNKKEIELSKKQLKAVMGSDWQVFTEKLLNNCHCPCTGGGYDVTIVDYRIFLNDLNDVILRGKCKGCGKELNRYLETGENEDCLNRINSFKK